MKYPTVQLRMYSRANRVVTAVTHVSVETIQEAEDLLLSLGVERYFACEVVYGDDS